MTDSVNELTLLLTFIACCPRCCSGLPGAATVLQRSPPTRGAALTALGVGSERSDLYHPERFRHQLRNPVRQAVAGRQLWRPSENVVYELGAASFAYEDRVVILKEKGIDFPTNFSSVGYIEFEEDTIEAKAVDILKELIGFELVKITTA